MFLLFFCFVIVLQNCFLINKYFSAEVLKPCSYKNILLENCDVLTLLPELFLHLVTHVSLSVAVLMSAIVSYLSLNLFIASIYTSF